MLAASNIRFTPGTIGRWARVGQLQSIKLGHRRYVRRTQVRSLLMPHAAIHDEYQDGLFDNLDN